MLRPWPQPPSWWPDTRRRGFDILAVVRAQLPPGSPDSAAWRRPLLDALRPILLDEFGSAPVITADQEQAIVRHLFHVALAGRNGSADAAEYAVRTDPEIGRALDLLDEPGAPR